MSRFRLDQLSPAYQAQAAAQLYKAEPPAAGSTPPPFVPEGVKDERTESQLQQELMRWWAVEAARLGKPEHLLMAFPLQGKRTKANASRMKAEGMRAGTPDMLLNLARGRYHGLWVEFKRPDGTLTDSQKDMLADLSAEGYAAFACYGLDAAQKLIRRYLFRPDEIF